MKKSSRSAFKQSGKTYYFDPAGMDIKTGDHVIVETARGTGVRRGGAGRAEVPDSQVVKQLKSVTRMADAVDVRRMRQNREDEKRAFKICEERIARHKLEMKLVDVEYTLDRSKILFYFIADGRIDFRELVKDLAGVFHTRIELRQIGVWDESKMLGGIGICGQVFCCSRFLKDFQPVSIKMAKEQGLSLNPAKISGACGRLMCCLAYEQKSYEYLNSLTPPGGQRGAHPGRRGHRAGSQPHLGHSEGAGRGHPGSEVLSSGRVPVPVRRQEGPQGPQARRPWPSSPPRRRKPLPPPAEEKSGEEMSGR